MLKRVTDIAIVSLLLVLLFPVMAVVSLLVLTTMGRPVLFSQIRPGLGGKPFRMIKFRTMQEDRDEAGNPLPDSARLTNVGRFLRSTSLDELPELLNVLKGDMSLVGPRPLLMEYLELYTPEQARRHKVVPGITGWAQVNGRNALSWDEKFQLDTWYVDHRSFWLDLRIIGLTLIRVLSRHGISQEGMATMEKFRGSPR
jgi:sugar transferase EpsL